MMNRKFLSKEEVEALQKNSDGLSLENEILQNELAEVLAPSLAQANATVLILQMLSEQNEYVRKYGNNERAAKSKERLLKLMDLNKQLSDVCTINTTLKNINRQIYTNYQILRADNLRLRSELKKINDAFDGV